MKRDEFFDKFPWLMQLPEHPVCAECLQAMVYQQTVVAISETENEVSLFMEEGHAPDCSRAKHYPGPFERGEKRSKSEKVLIERKTVPRE